MIIGFGHRAQVGKDTCGKIIQYLSGKTEEGHSEEGFFEFHRYEKPDDSWEIHKFAWKLKVSAAELLNVDVEEFEDPTFKNEKIVGWPVETVREFMDWYGTKVCRASFPDFWVTPLMANYALRSKYDPNWIITDVRFPNEAQAIKDTGGYVFKVERYDVPILDLKSENALSDWQGWDGVIVNDSTIEHLISKVKNVLGAAKVSI